VVDGEKPEVDFRDEGSILEGTICYSYREDDLDGRAYLCGTYLAFLSVLQASCT